MPAVRHVHSLCGDTDEHGMQTSLSAGPLRPQPPRSNSGLGPARAYLRSVDAVKLFDGLVGEILKKRPGRDELLPVLQEAIAKIDDSPRREPAPPPAAPPHRPAPAVAPARDPPPPPSEPPLAPRPPVEAPRPPVPPPAAPGTPPAPQPHPPRPSAKSVPATRGVLHTPRRDSPDTSSGGKPPKRVAFALPGQARESGDPKDRSMSPSEGPYTVCEEHALRDRRTKLLAELRSLDATLASREAVRADGKLLSSQERDLKRRRVLVMHTGGAMFSHGLNKYRTSWPDECVTSRSGLHDATAPRWHDGDHPLPVMDGFRTYFRIRNYEPLLDSCNIGSKDWARMAKDIEAAYADFDGFVIVHGTDTMAYTASALSFMLQNLSKPVILTGSQMPATVGRSDAFSNLQGALAATSYNITEVTVYFRGELLRGNRVSLSNTGSFGAFSCANFGALAEFDCMSSNIDWAVIRKPGVGRMEALTSFCDNVAVVALFPGMCLSTLRAQLSSAAGVVLQSYGAGNAPDSGDFGEQFLGIVHDASKSGTIIVNVTQAKSGFVAPHYKTGMLLRKRGGVVAGADMTVEAAFTKLGWLLGQRRAMGWSTDTVKTMFGQNLRGEMVGAEDSQAARFLQSVLLGIRADDEGESLLLCPLCQHTQQRKWTGADPQNRMKCDGCGARTHGWTPVPETETIDDDEGRTDTMYQREQEILHALMPTLLCTAAEDRELHQLEDIVSGHDEEESRKLVSLSDYDGRTGLHLAASVGNVPAIEFLAARGAPLSSLDNLGTSPLSCAAWGGHDDAVRVLTQLGAKLNLDPYRAAIDMCRLVSAHDDRRLALLLSGGQDPNVWDYDRRTPLHIAASNGSDVMVKLLVAHGASTQLKDCRGQTALDEAAQCGFKNIVKALEKAPALRSKPEQDEKGTSSASLRLTMALRGPGLDLRSPSIAADRSACALASPEPRLLRESLKETRSRRVLIIYTGGTIGMARSPDGYAPEAGYLPRRMQELPQICDAKAAPLPGFRGVMPASSVAGQITQAHYAIKEYEPLLDSCNMRSRDWKRIAGDIAAGYADYDAFVVLHGTDTMAYTASALSFMLENLGKPVVLTGSQIPLSESRNDGVDNLQGALIAASNLDVPEVTLYFAGKLIRGNRCTKSSASALGAFSSPNYPCLATTSISWDVRWELLWRTPGTFRVRANFCEDVSVVPLSPGMSLQMLSRRLTVCRGAVLQTFGSGNGPTLNDEFLRVVRDAIDDGVIIVNVTQSRTGEVDDMDGSPASALHALGVINGGDMTVEAALTKLGWMLGQKETMGWEAADIGYLFGRSVRGERKALRYAPANAKQRPLPKATIMRAAWGALRKDESLRDSDNQAVGIRGKEAFLEVKAALLPTILCGTAAQGGDGLPHLEDMLSVSDDRAVAASDYDGRTPLHIAASLGFTDVARLLLDAGADVNARDFAGVTPLREAVWHRRAQMVSLLREHDGKLDVDPLTACIDLCCLVNEDDVERLGLMLAAGQDPNVAEYDGRTPLHIAAVRGNLETCRLLVQNFANVSAQDRWGNTPVEEAEKHGHEHLAHKLRQCIR
eukprot:TRINITY_DN42965_c0_g1_i1.p1 TRINITY_DN42965_c0_g1~~TRINITY_DN42965_c0_g1_i1.p1  ORF type:complete len:1568 (+),score=432.02 TRINITY_DN42965_c0_g1_i1:81-4784(+)